MKIFLFLFFLTFLKIYSEVWLPSKHKLYQKNKNFFSYDLGYRTYEKEGDSYLYIQPQLEINRQLFGFSTSYRFNYLADDKSPENENGTGLGLQKKIVQATEKNYDLEDYDQIINYLWFGTESYYTPGVFNYFIFLGAITNESLGHGSIVKKYTQDTREESNKKIGISGELHNDFFSIQTFTNAVSNNNLAAGRISVRPLSLIKGFFLESSNISLVLFLTSVEESVQELNVADSVGRPQVQEETFDQLPEASNAMINASDPEERERAKRQFLQWLRDNHYLDEDMKRKSIFDYDIQWWHKLSLGYTYAKDNKAPVILQRDSTGKMIQDQDLNPKVENFENLQIEGYDIEYNLLRNDNTNLFTYCDQNRIYNLKQSIGTHCGINLKIGSEIINFTLQPEKRQFSANYIPTYFDTFYETERYQYKVIDTDKTSTFILLGDYLRTGSIPSIREIEGNRNLQDILSLVEGTKTVKDYLLNQTKEEQKQENFYYTPKLQGLKDVDIDVEDDKIGDAISLFFNFYDISVETSYENYDGKENSSFFLGVYVPIQFIFLSGYYVKKGFENSSEIFQINNKSLLSAELGLDLFGFGSIKLNVKRYWIYSGSDFELKEDRSIHFSQTIQF